MLSLLLAAAVGAAALPQLAVPTLYNTTNKHADFMNNDYPSLPNVYMDLYWNTSLFYPNYGRITGFAYTGVQPPNYYQAGALIHSANSSTGSLTSTYSGSTVDHFALNKTAIGCNAQYLYATASPGTGNQDLYLPTPVSCNITVKGYSKLNPLGGPIATTTFAYVPQDYTNVGFTSAGMQTLTFPRTFQFLNRADISAVLVGPLPQGVYPNSTVDILFTDLYFSVSRLALAL